MKQKKGSEYTSIYDCKPFAAPIGEPKREDVTPANAPDHIPLRKESTPSAESKTIHHKPVSLIKRPSEVILGQLFVFNYDPVSGFELYFSLLKDKKETGLYARFHFDPYKAATNYLLSQDEIYDQQLMAELAATHSDLVHFKDIYYLSLFSLMGKLVYLEVNNDFTSNMREVFRIFPYFGD